MIMFAGLKIFLELLENVYSKVWRVRPVWAIQQWKINDPVYGCVEAVKIYHQNHELEILFFNKIRTLCNLWVAILSSFHAAHP